MDQLFLKYIRINSQHEINIAGSLRNQFYEMNANHYESLSAMEMVTAYDNILREMLSMIEQSYRRLIAKLGRDSAREPKRRKCVMRCCLKSS